MIFRPLLPYFRCFVNEIAAVIFLFQMLLNECWALIALFQKHINEFTTFIGFVERLVDEFLSPTSLFLFRNKLMFLRRLLLFKRFVNEFPILWLCLCIFNI